MGQIMSYISLMDINSTPEYIDRISSMINDLPDSESKSNVLASYLTKRNQIEQTKNYLKNKKTIEKVEVDKLTRAEQQDIETKRIKSQEKAFDDDINRRVQQYLDSKKQLVKKTSQLDVIITPSNLLKVGSHKNILIKTYMQRYEKPEVKENVFSKNKGMPVLPIYDEK